MQIDGYFPDSSRTNIHHGRNGGLVITGTPGNRAQYANDRAIADWVLARGYAYAATDKGNTGPDFHACGRHPGDAIAEWHRRVTELNLAARDTARRYYGRARERVLAAGLSNGGYLVRRQPEIRPAPWDGGVDWAGTLWRAAGPTPLGFLPAAPRDYPLYAAGGPGPRSAGVENALGEQLQQPLLLRRRAVQLRAARVGVEQDVPGAEFGQLVQIAPDLVQRALPEQPVVVG